MIGKFQRSVDIILVSLARWNGRPDFRAKRGKCPGRLAVGWIFGYGPGLQNLHISDDFGKLRQLELGFSVSLVTVK